MKKLIAVTFVVAVIGLAAAASYIVSYRLATSRPTSETEPPAPWLTYVSEDYGFSVSYPQGWRVKTFSGGFPAVNIYRPDTVEETLDQPLIHHSNATHVSIFPNGVPTEGIIGQSQPSAVTLQPPTALATDFTLADGRVWATHVRFNKAPQRWDQSGYLWGAVQLDDLIIDCLIDGIEQPNDRCEPPLPEGSQLLRRAKVSAEDQAAVKRILESFTFTQPTVNNGETADARIRLDSPQPNEVVTSPLTITGEARGYWYFEASFPLELRDGNGIVIASGIAQAQSNWMVEDFVPFAAALTFEPPQTPAGTLILKKDNPSGLPEHDAQVTIPVQFQ